MSHVCGMGFMLVAPAKTPQFYGGDVRALTRVPRAEMARAPDASPSRVRTSATPLRPTTAALGLQPPPPTPVRRTRGRKRVSPSNPWPPWRVHCGSPAPGCQAVCLCETPAQGHEGHLHSLADQTSSRPQGPAGRHLLGPGLTLRADGL